MLQESQESERRSKVQVDAMAESMDLLSSKSEWLSLERDQLTKEADELSQENDELSQENEDHKNTLMDKQPEITAIEQSLNEKVAKIQTLTLQIFADRKQHAYTCRTLIDQLAGTRQQLDLALQLLDKAEEET